MSDTADFLNELLGNDLLTNEQMNPKVYSKVVLSKDTKHKLLSYQESHVIRLVNILLNRYIAIDVSDTGIGKTYIAVAVCKELGRKPIIVCPKSLIYNWNCVLSFFNVDAYDIVNYETLKNGKTYKNKKYTRRIKAPYLDKIEYDSNNLNKISYNWHVELDTFVIFDEAHRCKYANTDNGKLLESTKQLLQNKIPVLLISATICEKFTDMKIPFYLFNFIPNLKDFNRHLIITRRKYPKYRINIKNYPSDNEYKIAQQNANAMIIYEEIKDFTSRIRIKDLGDKFPSNQICCQQFIANDCDKIKEAYSEMANHLEELKKNPGKDHLAEIQKLKQEIEFRKIPIFIEQAQLYLEDGKSVIIFVNYLKSLHFIAKELDITCKIYGEQTMEERQKAIDLFQSNKEKIIICQIRAGGVGINLHDMHGDHPRVTLLNFPDNGSDLLQALGRAARAGSKTPVLQRIIFVANVEYEKQIMQNINRKLTNISAINDGDLNGIKYKVKVNKVTRKVISQSDSYDND